MKKRRLRAKGDEVTRLVTVYDDDTKEVLWCGSPDGMRDAVERIHKESALPCTKTLVDP